LNSLVETLPMGNHRPLFENVNIRMRARSRAARKGRR
jgi:hypothetical protein